MRKRFALAALGVLMAASSTASAADWTYNSDGSGDAVGTVAPGQSVFVDTDSEDTSILDVSRCSTVSFTVFATSISINPQICLSKADCETAGTNQDMFTSPLTGASGSGHAGSEVAFALVRVETTSDTIVKLTCGY